jgi:thioredoxin 1
MAQRVNAENFEEKVLKADKPVLLDFYSDTCIPCKRMAGSLGDIEDDYEGRLYVYKVNVNFDAELAEKYEVMSAPTLVVIVDGEEKNRMTGAAGKDKIKELFESYV